MSTQPPPQAHCRPRGIAFAILITIVTLGIYTLYWVFKTQEEVKEQFGIGVGA